MASREGEGVGAPPRCPGYVPRRRVTQRVPSLAGAVIRTTTSSPGEGALFRSADSATVAGAIHWKRIRLSLSLALSAFRRSSRRRGSRGRRRTPRRYLDGTPRAGQSIAAANVFGPKSAARYRGGGEGREGRADTSGSRVMENRRGGADGAGVSRFEKRLGRGDRASKGAFSC